MSRTCKKSLSIVKGVKMIRFVAVLLGSTIRFELG